MKSQLVNKEIASLLRARHTLLWIVSREEQRVERGLLSACVDAKFSLRTWDCWRGIQNEQGKQIAEVRDPSAAIEWLVDRNERSVFVMRDLHRWFDGGTLRALRGAARELQSAEPSKARSIIILSPSSEVPIELAGCTVVIDYPLPDRPEIGQLIDDVVGSLSEEIRATAIAANHREAAIDAAVGLTAEEAANCYAKSLVQTRRIDPAIVAQEKKRVVARERVLTWTDPDPRGLAGIGGLEVLKEWLMARRAAFSEKARAFGLPAPKGAMLVGVPGCGKSLTAKCIASAWGMPLLRLDMGALRSKFVGESEGNIRRALQLAETVSPCVLWIDEIEKALAGSIGPQGDGGVSADALGTVLSWMQEKAGSVFVVATANDVRSLPPELLRKGRFDELFFVDLPTPKERAAIAQAAVKERGRSEELDWKAIASVTSGFTGAEIAAIVPEALLAAFGDNERALTTADVLAAASQVTPLSKTASERITALRQWAADKARPASRIESAAASAAAAVRGLDINTP